MRKIENIGDTEKLFLLHLVVESINRAIKGKFNPDFIGYEPIITLTFSAKTGEFAPKLIKINGEHSFLTLLDGNDNAFTDPYSSDISDEELDSYNGKEVIEIESPFDAHNATNIDEVIFWAGIILFMQINYPITFLDALPKKKKKVSDDFSETCFLHIQGWIIEQDDIKLGRLLIFLKKFLPKNSKTKRFIEEIIYQKEEATEVLLSEGVGLDTEKLFKSAKKKN